MGSNKHFHVNRLIVSNSKGSLKRVFNYSYQNSFISTAIKQMQASLLRLVFDCAGHEQKEWNLKTFIVYSILFIVYSLPPSLLARSSRPKPSSLPFQTPATQAILSFEQTWSLIRLPVRVPLHLLDATNDWLINIDRGLLNYDTLLLDFSNSFDAVDHDSWLDCCPNYRNVLLTLNRLNGQLNSGLSNRNIKSTDKQQINLAFIMSLRQRSVRDVHSFSVLVNIRNLYSIISFIMSLRFAPESCNWFNRRLTTATSFGIIYRWPWLKAFTKSSSASYNCCS